MPVSSIHTKMMFCPVSGKRDRGGVQRRQEYIWEGAIGPFLLGKLATETLNFLNFQNVQS